MSYAKHWRGLPVLMVIAAPIATWAQSFVDSSLNVSNYSISTYVQTGTVSITNTAVDGNPGAALSVAYNTPAPAPFTSDVSSNTLVANTFTVNPALIAPGFRIVFSLDKNFSYTPTTYGGSNAQGFLISQGGQLFLHVVSLSNTLGVFQTAAFTSTQASDFVLFNASTGAVNSSVNPSFSNGLMQFGFTSSLSLPSGAPAVQARSIYDNFSVSVVPEPTTYALLLAGMGALLLFVRRQATSACAPQVLPVAA